MNLKDTRVIVTGGSCGIGFALAELMLARGARVVVSGRREHALRDAVAKLGGAGGDVAMFAGDVGDAADRKNLLGFAVAHLGGLDVLVNNAGAVRAGRLEHIPEEEIISVVQVDLLAPILLTRLALPELRKSGDSVVVNVASAAALTGVPFYGVYAAAKAGLARFGEGLRRELMGEGVHVVTAYPVATDTPMMSSSMAGEDLGFAREPVGEVAQAIIEGVEKNALDVRRGGEKRAKMVQLNWESPEKVDERFVQIKAALEEATKGHRAL